MGLVIFVQPNKKGCKRYLAAPMYRLEGPSDIWARATNALLF
jgi:hypothetical protein